MTGETEAFRKFGLEEVGAIPWGTHLCQLYQSKHELFEMMVPYVATGLLNNEHCLCVTASILETYEMKRALRKVTPELNDYFRKGQLEIVTYSTYFRLKEKASDDAIKNFLLKEEEILKNGFDGLRVASNTTWVSRKLWASFMDFEANLNAVIPTRRIIALCGYSLEKCKGTDILEIERNHVGTLVKRVAGWGLIENAVQRMKNVEEYRNMIQTSIDGFFVVDSSGNFMDANAAYCNLIGYHHNELMNMGLRDVEAVESEHGIVEHIRKITSQGYDRFETRHRHRNGQFVDVEISANYMNDDVRGRIYVFAHSISRRKRNEEALLQSESRYRELADSISDSFVALDQDLKYVYWNKAAEKITGIPAENAIGQHMLEVFKKDPGARKVATVYRRVLKTKKPRVFVDELLMNGRKVVVENHIYPSRKGIAVFTKDITQRKELQDKLKVYTQRLEDLVKQRTEKLKAAERLAAIGETAGMVGHDIRNPLQSICGELYLSKIALDSLQESEAKHNLKESIEAISEQTSYINKIVADLQDYAKTLVPYLEKVDLKEIINSILSSVTVPSDIRLEVSIQEDFPKFQSDSSYLRRILINLITNAVQAMPNGGNLTITANFDRQKASVKVRDTGLGIPDDAKDKIFKPLFTTKAKGQGLGLAVVKRLTNTLGGNITFESSSGKGTCFMLEIPFQISKNY